MQIIREYTPGTVFTGHADLLGALRHLEGLSGVVGGMEMRIGPVSQIESSLSKLIAGKPLDLLCVGAVGFLQMWVSRWLAGH